MRDCVCVCVSVCVVEEGRDGTSVGLRDQMVFVKKLTNGQKTPLGHTSKDTYLRTHTHTHTHTCLSSLSCVSVFMRASAFVCVEENTRFEDFSWSCVDDVN